MGVKDRSLVLARRLLTPGGLTSLSITVAAILLAWGAWQRR